MGIYLGLPNGCIGFHFLLYRRKKRLLKIIQRGGCLDPADVRLRAAPDPADVRLRAVGLDLQSRPIEYKDFQSETIMY